MTPRRFRMTSTERLQFWLAALEACPKFIPGVVDLRIAVRNELWQRDREAEQAEAWVLAAIEGAQ